MHKYNPIGKCIYCGETNLPPGTARFGDEHIIPYAFGGDLILPEASCRKCEHIINKEVETPVLRHEWGNLRATRNFPTRNKKRRRTHVKLRRRDGSAFRMPIKDYPSPTPLYKFSEARILSGLPYGADHLRWTVDMFADHDAEMAAKKKYPEWDEVHRIKAQPHEFARLIAKIAYGYASAELGVGTFDPIVTDMILGESRDYFYAVGGQWDIEDGITGSDHKMDISLLFKEGRLLVIVDIRLFSQARTPRYHAVVGRIDCKNREHIAAIDEHRRNGKITKAPFGES